MKAIAKPSKRKKLRSCPLCAYNEDQPHRWQTLSTIAEIKTKWVTIHGEELLDDAGNKLEYWRCERADSAIVIVRQGEHFVLPRPSYRPGVGKATLDFAGGRIADNVPPRDAAKQIVGRELNLSDALLASIEARPINTEPWLVDSSFSSQKLHGFCVDIPEGQAIGGTLLTADELLDQLKCLQCRGLLLELLRK